MAEVKVNVPEPVESTIDIIGLTPNEYQVVRNALFSMAEDFTDSTGRINMADGRTQREIAKDLHEKVVRFLGSARLKNVRNG